MILPGLFPNNLAGSISVSLWLQQPSEMLPRHCPLFVPSVLVVLSPPLTSAGPASLIPILRATYAIFNGPERRHPGVQKPDSPSIHQLYVDTFDTFASCLPLNNQPRSYPIYFIASSTLRTRLNVPLSGQGKRVD